MRLIRSKNVGPHTFFKVLKFFGDFQTAIDNINEFNFKTKAKNKLELATKEEIDQEIVSCSTVGAKIITYRNNIYPKLLLEINDFPPVLTALGNTELFTKRSVSIVGARNASSNGCNFARKIAKELGEAGYIVTSGFASGIDSSSHKGALATGTIAVLGGGVDDIYPRGNEELYYEIKNKGLIVSEVPFGSAPKAENFPARNRIVSGISEVIIIIEAGSRSGTIHTARQALDQGRELLVAPGNPYDYRCEGSNKLIKDGANVITSTEDVLEILENFSLNKNRQKTSFILEDINNVDINEFEEEIEVKEVNYNYENELIEKSLPTKEFILSKINHTSVSMNILENDLNLETNIISSNLIELELEGKIVIEQGFVKLR